MVYWETRESVPEGIIVNEGRNFPYTYRFTGLPHGSTDAGPVGGQDKARALIQDSGIVCIALPRFTGDPRMWIQLNYQISSASHSFPDHTDTVSWATYDHSALIIHQGLEATSGHYRAVVRKGSSWHIGDDARPPQECTLSDSCVQTDSYVLFLKRSEVNAPSSPSLIKQYQCRFRNSFRSKL